MKSVKAFLSYRTHVEMYGGGAMEVKLVYPRLLSGGQKYTEQVPHTM